MSTFRYAVRSLRRSPLFAAIAVVSLGLALALNTTMFALVDALIHPTIPYHDGGRAFTVMAIGGSRTRPTFEEKFRAIKSGMRSAEMVVPYYLNAAKVQTGNTLEDQYVANVPHEMFGILGVKPIAGRAFNANDERLDSRPVAIISYALWIRFFQGKSLDRRLTLEVGRGSYEVVGVMPRNMHWPLQDVWLPQFSVVSDNAAIRLGPWALMQLRPGVSQASAKAELDVVM
jgi:hypothetical protein